MKSLTTMLVDRAMAKQGMPQDPLAGSRAAAAAQLGAPVVDAAMFSRQSSDIATRAAGSATFGGPLARMALKKYEQSKAGGLPEHFLLAVTADEVVALERRFKAFASDPLGTAGAEVARWRRADLQIGVEDNGHTIDVTIASPGEDEEVRCAIGRITATEDFVALLKDPARQTRAQQFPGAA